MTIYRVIKIVGFLTCHMRGERRKDAVGELFTFYLSKFTNKKEYTDGFIFVCLRNHLVDITRKERAEQVFIDNYTTYVAEELTDSDKTHQEDLLMFLNELTKRDSLSSTEKKLLLTLRMLSKRGPFSITHASWYLDMSERHTRRILSSLRRKANHALRQL